MRESAVLCSASSFMHKYSPTWGNQHAASDSQSQHTPSGCPSWTTGESGGRGTPAAPGGNEFFRMGTKADFQPQNLIGSMAKVR